MAGRALTPATRRRLGGPLPRQLPDRSIAAPKAVNLCSVEIMGYYARFRGLIPHLRARSIVLLTLPPLTIAGPFDLHALTMPPAFNLSQNQTLHLIAIEHVRRRGLGRIEGSTCYRRPLRGRTGRRPQPSTCVDNRSRTMDRANDPWILLDNHSNTLNLRSRAFCGNENVQPLKL